VLLTLNPGKLRQKNLALAARGLLAMLLVVLGVSLGGALEARAQEEPSTDFFSYLPAAPEIKLPDLRLPFWTDDLKRAKKAYNKGEYKRAAKLFRKEAEDGNIVAYWYLGHMYRTGLGVQVDHAIAYSYYSRVAEAYDPDEEEPNRLRIMVDGQLRVAQYQQKGLPDAGIAANPSTAARTYLRLASTYGHPGAQYALGVMSIRGEGVKKNPQQGLKWLMAAARKRHPEAEAYLGNLYWDGKIVRRDETRALMWYILARDSARPEENPSIFERAEELRSRVSEEVRLEADARARVWADQYPVEDEP
jgi:TPR repeat protein